MNAELARQHARVQAARARIHRGIAPVPAPPQPVPEAQVLPPVPLVRTGPQPAHHVRAWRRVERVRAFGPAVEDILEVVSEVWRVSLVDVMSDAKFMCFVVPRRAAMYLCRQHTRRSLKDIGRRMGGRDHSTIVAACRAVETSVLHGDTALADRLHEVRRRLGLDVCGRPS